MSLKKLTASEKMKFLENLVEPVKEEIKDTETYYILIMMTKGCDEKIVTSQTTNCDPSLAITELERMKLNLLIKTSGDVHSK